MRTQGAKHPFDNKKWERDVRRYEQMDEKLSNRMYHEEWHVRDKGYKHVEVRCITQNGDELLLVDDASEFPSDNLVTQMMLVFG